MASTFTSSLNLELPARNDYQNQWDVPTNANWSAIDARIGGTLTLPLTNAEVDLTQTQARCSNIVLSGTLTANVPVTLPANCGGIFSVLNGTLGAFVASMSIFGAGGAAVALPPGRRVLIVADGTNVYFADQALPPGTPIPSLSGNLPGGFVYGYAQVLNQADQPGIYAAYGTRFNTGGEAAGTFRMPDLRGRVLAGRDNTGGTPAGILTSIGTNGQTLGAKGGEQSHVLIAQELAAHSHGVNDPLHSHNVYDPTHNHPYTVTNSYNASTSGAGGACNVGVSQSTTGASATGIGINAAATGISIQSSGQNLPHNNVQPAMLCDWIIKT